MKGKNRFLEKFKKLSRHDEKKLCYSVPEFRHLTTRSVDASVLIDEIKQIFEVEDKKLETPAPRVNSIPRIHL